MMSLCGRPPMTTIQTILTVRVGRGSVGDEVVARERGKEKPRCGGKIITFQNWKYLGRGEIISFQNL